jgi:GLPGLI family protein
MLFLFILPQTIKMGRYILFLVFILSIHAANAQKLLSEGSIQYSITLKDALKDSTLANYFKGALSIVYVKGSQSRTDIKTNLGITTSIFNNKTHEGVLLREFQSQKLLIRMNAENWADKNKKFIGITYQTTGDTMVIGGYKCEKAIALLSDGTSFLVFFTKELETENKSYDPQFEGLVGFPVAYESVMGDLTIQFTLAQISFDPVPVQKFAIPTKGYREISYDESLETSRGNKKN